MTSLEKEVLLKAQQFLSGGDPVMKALIEKSAPFALKPDSKQTPEILKANYALYEKHLMEKQPCQKLGK